MDLAPGHGAIASFAGVGPSTRTDDDHERRIVLATPGSPRLRPREGEALALARRGGAAKDIATALGIAPSSARALLSSATRKIGLRGRADLYRWVLVGRSGGEDGGAELRFTRAAIDEASLTPLSGAEQDVARRILSGETNAVIARRRGVSTRTVANQVASILRKLGQRSRADVVAILAGGRAETPSAPARASTHGLSGAR